MAHTGFKPPRHYFTDQPKLPSDRSEVTLTCHGKEFVFLTDVEVFSRRRVDFGTKLLATTMVVSPTDKVLDLGAGYGPLGIVAASLAYQGYAILVERNPRAAALAEENLRRNGIENAEVRCGDGLSAVTGEHFHRIFLNPPVRAGKNVYYPWIAKAPEFLMDHGSLWVVIRTKQGARSLMALMAQVFGRVETVAIKAGYRVLKAEKS
jgi:16S rRNA (guanine1207-N2)-methyltransferase